MRALAIVVLATACTPSSAERQSGPRVRPNAGVSSPTPSRPMPKPSGLMTTPSGLQYEILKAGLSEKPTVGQRVSVHYTGRFEDGKVFDSSVLQNRSPLTFPVGVGRVIKGWDEALLTMTLGEKRRLIIPPHLAYGKKGFGNVIPPDSTLFFEVELVGLLELPSQLKGGAAAPAQRPTEAKPSAPTTAPSSP